MKQHSLQLKAFAAAFALALPGLCLAAVSPVLTLTSTTELAGPPSCVVLNYTLADAPGIVLFDVLTNGVSIGGANIQRVSGDVNRLVQPGGNRVVRWFPGLDWPGHPAGAGDVTYRLTALPKDCPPLYMVVDLCAKSNVTYYADADFLPHGGIASDVYKADRLAMRRIDARGVMWQMGTATNSPASPNNVNDRIYQFPSEKLHEVTLTNNYYIGVYQVTQTQWQQITGYNPSCFTTDRTMRPVESVSYTDIRQGKGTATTTASATGGIYPDAPYGDSFLGLLRTKTILDFDLPSEAQWEFAARAGNGEGYWGDGSAMRISSNKDAGLEQLGRYQYNGGKIGANNATTPAGNCEATNATAIVGSYAPNAWGLYDMHGNVWVWCLDIFANDITALNGAVNTVSGTDRVFRGGSWLNGAESCRPACRSGGAASARAYNLGFRLVCTAGLQ